MAAYWRVLIVIMAVVLGGCTQEDLPSGILEFEVPAGKFRVAVPENWVETPELGGYHAVESPDLDFVFGVLTVDPSNEQLSIYRNPREYEANGREITVYDGPSGGAMSLYFGIEHFLQDALYATVSFDGRRYLVVLVRSRTVELRDEQEQVLVDLAASLVPVP